MANTTRCPTHLLYSLWPCGVFIYESFYFIVTLQYFECRVRSRAGFLWFLKNMLVIPPELTSGREDHPRFPYMVGGPFKVALALLFRWLPTSNFVCFHWVYKAANMDSENILSRHYASLHAAFPRDMFLRFIIIPVMLLYTTTYASGPPVPSPFEMLANL